MLTEMSVLISGKIVYSWLDIHPYFEVIHKHNWNGISYNWYDRLVLMKSGCEIKMIERKIDVVREIKLYWNMWQYNEEELGWFFDIWTQCIYFEGTSLTARLLLGR